jgi:hypothetical protein
METTMATMINDDSDNEGDADNDGDNGDNHNGNDDKATTKRPRQQDHDNETTTRYNNQLNGVPSAVDCNDDDDDDGNSNGNGNGDGKGDGDGEGNGGSTRCNDNDDDNNNNPLPVIVNVVVIQGLSLCRAVTTTAAAGWQGGSCRRQGLAGNSDSACCNNDNIDHDDDHPLPIVVNFFVIGRLSLCGARLTTVVGRRWVAVVDKAGRTAVDRDKRDGATCCDDNDNHPYPVVADVVIIWRLRLCGDGMTTAAAGRQRGGEDRGSGHHSPAVVERGSKIKVYFSRYLLNRKPSLVAGQSKTVFGGNRYLEESGGIQRNPL